MITSTNGQIYLIALNTLDRLHIQFVPEAINVNSNARVSEIAIVGKNLPHHHWTSSTQSLPLKLDFYGEKQEVVDKVRWLQQLVFRDGQRRPAQPVMLILGDLFRGVVWVVKSVNVEYSIFDNDNNFMPKQAYVSLNLSRFGGVEWDNV